MNCLDCHDTIHDRHLLYLNIDILKLTVENTREHTTETTTSTIIEPIVATWTRVIPVVSTTAKASIIETTTVIIMIANTTLSKLNADNGVYRANMLI